MAKCKYCGEAVGFLRAEHPQCRERYLKAHAAIEGYFRRYLIEQVEAKAFGAKILAIAKAANFPEHDRVLLPAKGLDLIVESALDDGYLSDVEEDRIAEYINCVGPIPPDDVNRAKRKLVKLAILKDLSENKIVKRLSVEGELPISLQKDERLIWVFHDVCYLEQKTRTQYVGGYSGVSVRVAKGVYIRAGGSRGERIQTSEQVHVDDGNLYLTNKHVYFKGYSKAFRIRHSKILSVDLFSDAIQLFRDVANPKPQTFMLDDPWFAANLINHFT